MSPLCVAKSTRPSLTCKHMTRWDATELGVGLYSSGEQIQRCSNSCVHDGRCSLRVYRCRYAASRCTAAAMPPPTVPLPTCPLLVVPLSMHHVYVVQLQPPRLCTAAVASPAWSAAAPSSSCSAAAAPS
eukprot:319489-Chlamydomonas_euryale.AAC.2